MGGVVSSILSMSPSLSHVPTMCTGGLDTAARAARAAFSRLIAATAAAGRSHGAAAAGACRRRTARAACGLGARPSPCRQNRSR